MYPVGTITRHPLARSIQLVSEVHAETGGRPAEGGKSPGGTQTQFPGVPSHCRGPGASRR